MIKRKYTHVHHDDDKLQLHVKSSKFYHYLYFTLTVVRNNKNFKTVERIFNFYFYFFAKSRLFAQPVIRLELPGPDIVVIFPFNFSGNGFRKLNLSHRPKKSWPNSSLIMPSNINVGSCFWCFLVGLTSLPIALFLSNLAFNLAAPSSKTLLGIWEFLPRFFEDTWVEGLSFFLQQKPHLFFKLAHIVQGTGNFWTVANTLL